MRRGTVAMLLALAVAATIEAQKSGGNGEQGTGSGEQETAGGDDPIAPPRSGGFEVTNLCFTSISVASNEATLDVSWPLDFIETGSKIDLFAFTSLDAAEQTWLSAHVVAAAETNWTPTVDTSCLAPGTDAYPPMLFFSAAVRADPGDLRDTDGDSIPDAYEIRNGGNPYVTDYVSASKLTVCPSGPHPTIASALAASRDYSIIELDPAFVHDVADVVHVPAHPVMVCSPPGTCAVVRATQFAAFLLDTNVTSRTLFKNLYVLLDARSSYQTAFFVGGNVPWNSVAASATFEDIYIRMPNSGVEYFGWLFYANGTDTVRISDCTINAAGSEWAYGMQAFVSPPLSVENCSFVNFPPNLGGTHASCGMLLRSSPGIGGGADVSVSRSLFDESFTNAVMFGRLEGGASNVLSVADCIAPRDPEKDYPLDEVSGLVLTNAALAWAGFPWPHSPSVALGVGSLSPIVNDSAMDSDDDGLYDYHEVYDLGTDPFLADTDRDGIPDGVEIEQGTDPANPHSFLQNLTVSVTNTVSLSHAAYVAYGDSSDTWEANGLVSFHSGFGSTLYTNASAQAATRVKAFCDLDDDGEFSATTDILISTTIPQSPSAHITFSFGDVDGDGVNDEQERTDGTNPYSSMNFKFRGTRVSYTDVDPGHGYTNIIALSQSSVGWTPDEAVATFSSTTFTYTADAIATGGVVYVKCLRDLDGDGELDADVEQMVVTTLSAMNNGKTVDVIIGDYDGDGVGDGQELQDGTDPYDAYNLRIHRTIEVSNSDFGSGVTNILAVTQGASHWEPDCIVTSFTGYGVSYELDVNVTNRYAYVKCLRDFAGDGDIGNSTNVLYAVNFGRSPSDDLRYAFLVGDRDGDGVSDSDEMIEGTDALNGAEYCLDLSVTISRIFVPSNGLSAVAYFGVETNVLYGPCAQGNSVLTVNFGHLSTVSREKMTFRFWEDIDGNGMRDAGERQSVLTLPVVGHSMCVTNMMPLGEFDADGDGMPDDWELEHGLSPSNAVDAAGDADGDGFMNLHEYWAGTDPNDSTDDGNGTALYAATHAVDDRIADKTGNVVAAKNIYENYIINVFNTNQVRNADCWIADIDVTCSSIWNDDPGYHYGDCATLITPQHVVLAAHLGSPIGRGYIFRATNGTTTVRCLIDKLRIGSTDITVGLLESPLPAEYTPAKLLSPDYERHLGTGRLIPVFHQNKYRQAFVVELPNLATWMTRYEINMNYGSTSSRYIFRSAVIGHDSGNPCFMLINDQRILLYATHIRQDANGAPGGPHTALYVREMQAAIDTMSDRAMMPYQMIQYFDLSSLAELHIGGL